MRFADNVYKFHKHMSIATVFCSLSNGAQISLVGLYFDEICLNTKQPILFHKYTLQAQPELKYSQCDIFSSFFWYFSHWFLKCPILQDQKRKILTLNILIEKILVYVVDSPLNNISWRLQAIWIKIGGNIVRPVLQNWWNITKKQRKHYEFSHMHLKTKDNSIK